MKRIAAALIALFTLIPAAFAAQQIIVTVTENTASGIVSVVVPGPQGAPGIGSASFQNFSTLAAIGAGPTYKGQPILATIPQATADVLGGVKIGTGLAVDPATGRLNNTGISGVASFNSRGGAVKPGFNDYSASMIKGISTAGKTGAYSDLTGKPTIPAAQVNSDWSASSGVAQILNKPTIPTALSQLTQSSGYRTVTDAEKATWNASSNSVNSVNGQTGTVTLSAADVGADALGSATSVAGDLETHAGLINNPHSVTKSQVGLGNADNTSDANKPISSATQTALDAKLPITTFASYTSADRLTKSEAAGMYARPTLDARDFSGADIGQKISNAWAYAVAQGWTGAIVDARGLKGIQTTAGSLFNNYPYSAGNSCTFAGTILLDPSTTIRTDVSQVLPCNAVIDGGSPHAGFAADVKAGANIQASNTFPTDTPLIQYGAASWAGVTGGTPPQGIQLRNLGIICLPPNNTFVTGSIGILNQFAQEQSGGEFLHIDGCQTAINIENGGTISGSLNSGPFSDIHINMGRSNTTAARAIVVGGSGVATQPIRGFRNVSLNTSGAVVKPDYGITIDGSSVPMENIHIEGFNVGILVGGINFAQAVSLRDVNCVGLSGSPSTTCVEISNHSSSLTKGIVIESLKAVGSITNVLVDNMANGGTVPVSSYSAVGLYVRDADNQVISSTPSILSTAPQKGAGTAFKTASYTAVAGDNGKTLLFNSASNIVLTMPAVPPYTGWGLSVLNYGAGSLTINWGGAVANGSTSSLVLAGGMSNSVSIATTSTNYYYQPGRLAPHASRHAKDATDPITPAAIGAATEEQGGRADTALQPGDIATYTVAPFGATWKADYYCTATDCGPVFQTVMDAIKASGKGGKVKVREGTYPFTSTVNGADANSVLIEGVSPVGMWAHYGTIFVQSADVKMFSFTRSTMDPRGVQFSRIHFKSDATKTQPVLYYQNAHNMSRTECYFDATPQAVYAERAWDFWDVNNNYRDCGKGNTAATACITAYNGATDKTSGWKFIGNRWESRPGASFFSDVSGASGLPNDTISFTDNKFEGVTSAGYPAITGGMQMARVENNYFYLTDPAYSFVSMTGGGNIVLGNIFKAHSNYAVSVAGERNLIIGNSLQNTTGSPTAHIQIASGTANRVTDNTRPFNSLAMLTDSGTSTVAYRNEGAENNGIGHLSDWPAGLDATELGYVNGVTSGIQSQMDSKPTATLVTAVGSPGSDSNVPSEKAVRSAIAASSSGLSDPGSNGVVTRTSVNTTGVAAYGDIVALFGSGSCSGFLKNDGTCAVTAGMVYPGAGVPNSTGSAWGTSYTVGTGVNNLVKLDASSKLPAVDGSALTMVGVRATDSITAIGRYALGSTTGANNTAFGRSALANVGAGTDNVGLGRSAGAAIVGGSSNLAIGTFALFANQSGNSNVAIGQSALNSFAPTDSSGSNVAIGTNSGSAITTGTRNTFIGYQSGYSSPSTGAAVTRSIAIGYNAAVATDNTAVIGGAGADAVTIRNGDGTFSVKPDGTIDGKLPLTVTTATSNAVESPEILSGMWLNNTATAGAAVTYTLPTAAAGKQRCYRNYTGKTGVLTIQTSAAGQYIDVDGANTASGGNVTSGGALGDSACFVGVDSTHWIAIPSKGTWTAN